MPVHQIERFEAAAGSLLDELNYPRACPDPPPEARQHAADIRDRFIKDRHYKELPRLARKDRASNVPESVD